MSDTEKFEGFKKKMIGNNEAVYGKELRERYGDKTIDASNAKVADMSEAQWKNAPELSDVINQTLKEAFELGDPAGEIAQKACDFTSSGCVCSGRTEPIPKKHIRLWQTDMWRMKDLRHIMIKLRQAVQSFYAMRFTFIAAFNTQRLLFPPGYSIDRNWNIFCQKGLI